MSAPEMTRGLLANCVAARAQALPDPAQRKLIWWLQKVSWQPQGLEKLAEEIIAFWPERFATKVMQKLGFGPTRIYSTEEVKVVRKSIASDDDFPLRGESDVDWGVVDIFTLMGRAFMPAIHGLEKWGHRRTERAKELRQARNYPRSYPASDFHHACIKEAKGKLADFLFQELCLNPAVVLSDETLWYFPQLVETLQELHDLRAAEAASAAPTTEIGGKVSDSLEFALAERGLVVIDGVARTGKTFAVQAWCDARPGEARYVQVPPSNDDLSFYRALCASLGLGGGLTSKAHELRAKIEAVLQTGDLLLVLDEGHYLWPQRNMRKAMPYRINWMLTQLVNMGVPVAVVTTPQFTKNQERLVKNGGWSSEQLTGRIMHYERLPDSLSESDLEAVARHWLPEGDADSIRTLITYAQSSEKYLQAIESLVKRARFVARKSGRENPAFVDVASALQAGVIPSDNALTAARIGAQPAQRRQAPRKAAVVPVQTVCKPVARSVQPLRSSNFSAPARDAGSVVLSSDPP